MGSRARRASLIVLVVLLLIGGGTLATLRLRSPAGRHAPNRQALGVDAAAANKNGFTLSASPANLNVPAGTQGAFTVTINRTSFTQAISFAVSGLPAGFAATFAPTSTTGNTTTLYVTPPLGSGTQGSYNPVITGTSGSTVASTTVHLVVSAGQAKQFAISGTLDRALAPGVTGSLDLSLTNPNNQPITVSGLTVTIVHVSKPSCAASDNYSIKQFTGSVTVPANSTNTLSALGATALPQITMVDLPSNQDVCKGATLTLSYTGSGTGN